MIENMTTWHPILVHFTVALFTVSALLFVVALLAPGRPWKANALTAAHWNLWIGAALTVATVAAGFYAFNTVDHDDQAHPVMLAHRNWALATAILFWALALWSAKTRRGGGETGPALVVVLVVATGLLFTAALKGGELVYRHGLGVASLPVATGAGHDHGAGGHGTEETPEANHHDDEEDHHDGETADAEPNADHHDDAEDQAHGEDCDHP